MERPAVWDLRPAMLDGREEGTFVQSVLKSKLRSLHLSARGNWYFS